METPTVNCDLAEPAVDSNASCKKSDKKPETPQEKVKTSSITSSIKQQTDTLENDPKSVLKKESLMVANEEDMPVNILSRSNTFAEDNKPEKPKSNRKSTAPRLESQSTCSRSASLKLKPTESQASLEPSTSSSKCQNQSSKSKLPHALGSIPKYLQKGLRGARPKTASGTVLSMDSSASISQSLGSPSQVESLVPDQRDEKSEEIKTQKKQINAIELKLREAKNAISRLTGDNDKLTKTLNDTEKELNGKTQQLNEKLEKEKVASNKVMKAQRDARKANEQNEEKLKIFEVQVEELVKKMENKDAQIEKMNAELKRLKRDLGLKEKSNESLVAEKDELLQMLEASNKDQIEGQADLQRENQLQQRVEDLEDQLKSRNFELSSLKTQSNSLIEENESLKAQSIAGVEISQKSENGNFEQLKREICDLQNNEKQMKQQVFILNSKLNDEKNKNCQNENLLQLRNEYIKSMQDTDEVYKARLLLQVKEVEDLHRKVAKAKTFKVAAKEELDNLHNTLKSQEFQIQQLEHQLKATVKKLMKYEEH